VQPRKQSNLVKENARRATRPGKSQKRDLDTQERLIFVMCHIHFLFLIVQSEIREKGSENLFVIRSKILIINTITILIGELY
jgi:hypothetical protein